MQQDRNGDQQLSSSQLRELRRKARDIGDRQAVQSRDQQAQVQSEITAPEHIQQPETEIEASNMNPETVERLAQEASAAQERVLRNQQAIQPTPKQPPANSDINDLVFAGAIEEEFTVAGYTFQMHTLTGDESTTAWAAVSTYDGIATVNRLYIETLARSIDTINGYRLEELYKGKDQTLSSIEKRLKVVGNWQHTLITQLFEVYSSLVERSREAITEAQEKN